MCGILGSFDALGRARRFPLSLLEHRGPDGNGEYLSPSGICWLGHTRLAILDLSPSGQQPMADKSNRFRVVFNGEIYNHHDIRKSMPKTRWLGDSDTETLVEAWANFGEKCLASLRGMFAFAIFDIYEDRLTLVRDRLGIKPCYFCISDRAITFASEIRTLNDGRRPALDQTSVVTYLSFGHLQAHGQIGTAIEILPAGSMVTINSDGKSDISRWWHPNVSSSTADRRKLAVPKDEIRRLIESSVAEHLLSDVPIGCFLSGGLDSSILTVAASRQTATKLNTYTVGFPGSVLDERKIARLVATQARTEHTEIEVNAQDCQQWIIEAVAALDCPSVDAINTYIVSRSVRESGLKVALSGLGGDELLGGYPSFQRVPKLLWLRYIPRGFVDRFVSKLPKRYSDKLSELPTMDAFGLALGSRRWESPDSLRRYIPEAKADYPTALWPAIDYFAQVSDAEMRGYMEPMLLRDSDQMSMAVSLELRVPLLDHRLVEYCMSLPAKIKNCGRPKQLLIDAYKDCLPQEVWNRPKMGFTLPMDDWMRASLKDFVETGLKKVGDILKRSEIANDYQLFRRGDLHWTRIWRLVVLGHYISPEQI